MLVYISCSGVGASAIVLIHVLCQIDVLIIPRNMPYEDF